MPRSRELIDRLNDIDRNKISLQNPQFFLFRENLAIVCRLLSTISSTYNKHSSNYYCLNWANYEIFELYWLAADLHNSHINLYDYTT